MTYEAFITLGLILAVPASAGETKISNVAFVHAECDAIVPISICKLDHFVAVANGSFLLLAAPEFGSHLLEFFSKKELPVRTVLYSMSSRMNETMPGLTTKARDLLIQLNISSKIRGF